MFVDENESTMCDQVINEHFQRSLGRDYVNVFAGVKPIKKNQRSEEVVSQSTTSKNHHKVDVETREVIRNTSTSTLSGTIFFYRQSQLCGLFLEEGGW